MAHVSVLNIMPFYARAGVPAYWIVVPERDPADVAALIVRCRPS